ncbi:DUF4251 domain-containing protein [Halosquirtibacter laminarini]|uniref:DUF4251 domain-containing protein n=1 Tax=Halosquirtibacter laminarini TaxID=3374600 RepID=A0AC61NJ85_9BACT|nr:DUF4251 domain-containing protein [Prolixibacteraceae bacterium]
MKAIKKITILSLFVLFVFSGQIASAQEPQNNEGTPKELTRKEKRAIKKKQKEEAEKLAFEKAANALENNRWVLEANTVYDKRGRSMQVTSNTNFVMTKGEEVYVQLAFQNVMIGPNGIGGITLKGRPTKKEITKDKHGNITLNMSVIGNALTVDIQVNLTKDGNYADATVNAITRGQRVRFSGNLYDISDSTYYKSGMDF